MGLRALSTWPFLVWMTQFTFTALLALYKCARQRGNEFHRRGNAPLGVPCCLLPASHSLCPWSPIPSLPHPMHTRDLGTEALCLSTWRASGLCHVTRKKGKENRFASFCVALTTGTPTSSLFYIKNVRNHLMDCRCSSLSLSQWRFLCIKSIIRVQVCPSPYGMCQRRCSWLLECRLVSQCHKRVDKLLSQADLRAS